MHSDEGKNHSEEGYIVTPLYLVRFLKIGVLGDREFAESGAKKFWNSRNRERSMRVSDYGCAMVEYGKG
jgi:hypothetical protein